MAWRYWTGYERGDHPIGAWNVGIDGIGVPINLAKYSGLEGELPLLADGDVMRLFPIKTNRVPLSFHLYARDNNLVPIIDGLQLNLGLAYLANDDDIENETGRFPVEVENVGRYQEYFCTINVDSVAPGVASGRIDIAGTTFDPRSVVQNSPRRAVASIKDNWRYINSTSELPVPDELDVVLTFVAIGTNPMIDTILGFTGIFPDRVAQISESKVAKELLDD